MPELAPWVRDGEVTGLGPSSCRVVLGSWSWAGLLAAIVAFDVLFTMVGPESLRVAAATLASRMLAAATKASSGVAPAGGGSPDG